MSIARRLRGNEVAWPLALAGLWLWTWRHLAVEWGINDQYEHGFVVPFLFVFLLWQNWRGEFAAQPMTWTLWACVILGWLLFLLGELLRRHDPIWRTTGGCLMLSATLITLVWLYRLGGKPLVHRQALPLALAWLALPWPVPIELAITQNLLRFLTSATVAAVNTWGIAALQHGNTIELSNGHVGMENACSGVQSLQAATMAALFLGQLYRLGAFRAGWLLLAGWMVALAANFGRVIFLTFMVHRHGEGAVARFHDGAGYSASALTFLLIGLLALFMSRDAPPRAREEPVKPRTFAGAEGITVLIAFSCVPLLAAAWFSVLTSNGADFRTGPRWKLNTQNLREGWHSEIWDPPPHERASLQYSERDAVRVTSPSGTTAHLLHFFWNPGTHMPTFAFSHTPQMCLPSLGWEMIGSPRTVSLELPGTPLPCVEYRFRREGIEQVVWQSLFTAGSASTWMVRPSDLLGSRDRLAMLWKAPREQINEELLMYLPLTGLNETPAKAAEAVLTQVLVAQ